MPGSAVYDGDGVPLARPAAVVRVARYDPEAESGEKFELLPNVRCLSIQKRDGADPWAARFRYVFGDPLLDPDTPRRLEHVYPFDAAGFGVVSADDRLVVRAFRDDGYSEILFDGFVQLPQADLDRDTESVTFSAFGVPIREWDTPLGGALYRPADDPENTGYTATKIPARFNPDGKPNASPEGWDEGEVGRKYPVFLGPVWPADSINGATIRPWTLAMGCRYAIENGCDENYVDVKDTRYLDELLTTFKAGADDDGVYDPEEATLDDIFCPDYEITGMAWPVAVEQLVAPHGFGFRWVLEEVEEDDGDGREAGEPVWSFRIFDVEGVAHTKELRLQAAGEAFDPALTNLAQLSLARDSHDLVNTYRVDTAPVRYEASFVLAPGFHVSAGDATALTSFQRGNAAYPGHEDDYRLFIFDETAEGHWDKASAAWVTTEGDLNPVLQPANATFTHYASRRRPGIGTLVSTDEDSKPLKWVVHVSTDYTGPKPGVWDGTGTWQEVKSGEMSLLADRLGIRVTAADANAWNIGVPDPDAVAVPPVPGGNLCLVERIAAPTVAAPYPHLRLTCCVDDDWTLDGMVAPRRPASPSAFFVERRIDARDRYRKTVISKWSHLSLTVGTSDETVIDDTDEALAYARARRRHTESGSFAGSATIPRLSTAYDLGDHISGVAGRDVSLRCNAGAELGEEAVYPAVVSVSWNFDGQQSTTLDLQDRRAAPLMARRNRVRPGDDE